MRKCVVCGNKIIIQRCRLKERDYHGGIIIHYRCEKHIVTVDEQKNENSVYEKFNAL